HRPGVRQHHHQPKPPSQNKHRSPPAPKANARALDSRLHHRATFTFSHTRALSEAHRIWECEAPAELCLPTNPARQEPRTPNSVKRARTRLFFPPRHSTLPNLPSPILIPQYAQNKQKQVQ